MIPLDKAKQAYYNDPAYHEMVDRMVNSITQLELSPLRNTTSCNVCVLLGGGEETKIYRC